MASYMGERSGDMSQVYAVANQKGGVGKTTTVVNVGAYLAEAGKRVLIIDIDPQANATSSLGVDKNKVYKSIYDTIVGDVPLEHVLMLTKRLGLDLIPSAPALAGAEIELVSVLSREHRLRRALNPLRDRYDYVLIDCPPSLGLLTINALTAADEVIVPIQCEYLPMEGLAQLLHAIEFWANGGDLWTLTASGDWKKRTLSKYFRIYFIITTPTLSIQPQPSHTVWQIISNIPK